MKAISRTHVMQGAKDATLWRLVFELVGSDNDELLDALEVLKERCGVYSCMLELYERSSNKPTTNYFEAIGADNFNNMTASYLESLPKASHED